MNKECIILRSENRSQIYVPRALTEDEIAYYQKANAILLAFGSIADLFSLVEFNGKNILSTHNHWFQQYRNRINFMESPDLTSVRMDMNRAVLNFFAMVRTLTDHIETYLKRTYGKSSPKVEAFKAALSRAYDNSVSYRLMYQLRNYAQHCGLPIQRVSFSSQRAHTGGPEYTESFLALCDRDFLLKDFDGWKNVRKDLEQQEKEIDIVPHILEYMQCLFDVYEAIMKIDTDLIGSARFMRKLLEGIEINGFIPCVGRMVSQASQAEKDEESKYTMQDIPLDIADHVLAVSTAGKTNAAEL